MLLLFESSAGYALFKVLKDGSFEKAEVSQRRREGDKRESASAGGGGRRRGGRAAAPLRPFHTHPTPTLPSLPTN
jgi:hypothetical protein